MQPPHSQLPHNSEVRIAQVERDIERQPEIAGFQGYERLVNNNGEVRDAFTAATEGNPELVYKRLIGEELELLVDLSQSAEASLVTLMGSERTARVDALFDALEYRQAEIFMIYLVARIHDDDVSDAERAEAAEWFKLANEALYGAPNKDMFSAVTRKHLTPHLAADFSDDPEAAALQAEIAARVGTIEDTGYELYQPSPESEARFTNLVHERFDPMMAHVQERYEADGETEKLFTAEQVAEEIRIVLDFIGATELGWRCELIPDKELLAVSAHQKLVEVGENREPMGAAELRAKIAHEVGVHVLRSVNAERAGWPSAAYGQQGYLDFEESFANKVGAVYWGEAAVAAPQYRYIIDGLAYGLDNHEPRDARDCYEIMWRAIALDTRKAGKPLDIAAAQKTAYLQCNRMFRGTPFYIPGLTMNKDLSYQRGDEVVNPIIDLIETQEDIDLLLAGKLDPTLYDHLPIAEDIMPNTPLATKIRGRYSLAA